MPTLLHRLDAWERSSPSSIAQRYKAGNQWHSITVRRYFDRITHICAYLKERGFVKGDVGCIVAPNSPQWVQADLGVLLASGLSAGLSSRAGKEESFAVLENAKPKVLFLENEIVFERLREHFEVLGYPEILVSFEGKGDFHKNGVSFEDVLSRGSRLLVKSETKVRDQKNEWLEEISPGEGAFLIYTSGTTGSPKGALLSHANMCFAADCAISRWKLGLGGELYSFLPLSHVAERVQCVAVATSIRGPVSFASRIENVNRELPEVEPTLLLCVPRVWEKLKETVEIEIERLPRPVKMALEESFSICEQYFRRKKRFGTVSPLLKAKFLVADSVVSMVRKKMGLRRVEVCASGAAGISLSVLKWFQKIGVCIEETYGQTESCGILSMTVPDKDMMGTVGVPVKGVDVKIAEDGEIWARGPNIFLGYFHDEQTTKEILSEGWLKTGDRGRFDKKGRLLIEGRKKDFIKTSGGKMISPMLIEKKLRSHPSLLDACVVGEGRKYLVALFTLNEDVLQELKRKRNFVKFENSWIEDPQLIDPLIEFVGQVNEDFARSDQIKAFRVLSQPFDIQSGELTSSMKIKRQTIEKNYRSLIDQMYRGVEG